MYEEKIGSVLDIARFLEPDWSSSDKRVLEIDFFNKWCKYTGIVNGIQNSSDTLKQDLTSLMLKQSKEHSFQAKVSKFHARVQLLF